MNEPTVPRGNPWSTKAIGLTILPLVVVVGEIIIRKAAGSAIMPGVGSTLAALGLGQVMPLMVFESLLATKVLSLSGTYTLEGQELSVRYLAAAQRDVKSIEKLRSISLLIFVSCLLIWMAAVSFSLRLSPGQTFSYTSTVLGVINCGLAWFFLVKV